ncbi:MAG: hypothetical protein AAB674_00440, partial [Patescibacteria group bacterium]
CGVSLQQLIGSAKIGSNLVAAQQIKSSLLLLFNEINFQKERGLFFCAEIINTVGKLIFL